MWTSAQLKARAKEKLKKYFIEALIVSMIVGFITGNGGGGSVGVGGSGVSVGTEVEDITESMEESLEWGEHVLAGDYDVDELVDEMPHAIKHFLTENRMFTSILVGTIIVSLFVSMAINIFVVPIIEVSKNRYYMESLVLDRGAGVGKLIWGFNRNYLNIVWTMFLRGFIIFLGTLCCVIPGIYAAFCFYMVPYILAENPVMRAMEALRLSNEMMRGNKFGTFVLRLSFFGWILLASFVGAFTCGLGTFLVIPYIEATVAELYAELREPFAGGLNGFGYPEYGPYGPGPEPYYGGPQNDFGPQDSSYVNSRVVEPEMKEQESQESGWGYETHDRSAADSNEHVRGYYLNGVFYPYTEEELRAMDGDK